MRAALKIKPVTGDTWPDFETLFQSKGAPSYCWCMAWRMTREELKNNNSKARKRFIKKRVSSGTPIGLLGYIDNEPTAWCSIAPRGLQETCDDEKDIAILCTGIFHRSYCIPLFQMLDW